MNENLISLGRITKTHGYSGGLIFTLNTLKTQVLRDFEWIFIQKHGEKVPYKVIERSDANNAKMVINLMDVEDENAAKSFVNCEFYLPDIQIDLTPSDEILLSGLEGWKLYHFDNYLGVVVEVIENKAQVLLSINGEGSEFLVPFVNEFIVDISADEKSIIMNIPDGLIDL